MILKTELQALSALTSSLSMSLDYPDEVLQMTDAIDRAMRCAATLGKCITHIDLVDDKCLRSTAVMKHKVDVLQHVLKQYSAAGYNIVTHPLFGTTYSFSSLSFSISW